MKEHEIRSCIYRCINYLCGFIPALESQKKRFLWMTNKCRINIIGKNEAPYIVQKFWVNEKTAAHVSLKCMSQVADIRPYFYKGEIFSPVPLLVIRQEITCSGLLHEISHLLSTGFYYPTNDGFVHKRGIICEEHRWEENSLRLLSANGDVRTNECLTDLCAEELFRYIYPEGSFLRNERYFSFLENHPELDRREAVEKYLSDNILKE